MIGTINEEDALQESGNAGQGTLDFTVDPTV